MIPELRILDFKFLEEISNKEKTLNQIKYVIEPDCYLSVIQKTLAKLENVGFVKSERRGRQRFVKITPDGRYFLKYYLKKQRKKG